MVRNSKGLYGRYFLCVTNSQIFMVYADIILRRFTDG